MNFSKNFNQNSTVHAQNLTFYYGVDDLVTTWKMDANFWTRENTVLNTLQTYHTNMMDVLIANSEMQTSTAIGTYETILIDFRNDLHNRGMLLGLQLWYIDNYSPFDSSTDGWKVDVVNNVNGLGDRWINEYGKIISAVHPDLINVFSEPAGDLSSGYASSAFLTAYINFVDRAIDAWRNIQSNLTFAVMGMPFWDLKPLIDAGGVQRSNVIYALHYYYAYDGAYPASNYQAQRDYWTGNLATAKAELYSDFFDDAGIQDALNAGKTVWFEALGTNTTNPNANVFVQDAVNFCKQYGISFISSGASNSDNWPWPWIFNTDGTLNSMGFIMLSAVPHYNLDLDTTTGGTTTPSPADISYLSGSTPYIKAIPDENHVFSTWELDGTNDTSNPIQVPMLANHTLTAYFNPARTRANTETYIMAAAVIGITAATGLFGLALRRKRNRSEAKSES